MKSVMGRLVARFRASVLSLRPKTHEDARGRMQLHWLQQSLCGMDPTVRFLFAFRLAEGIDDVHAATYRQLLP